MASVKVHQAQCPTCGASLPIPPESRSVACRYCQNVIEVERARPPADHVPFGAPGAVPQRKVYVDPAKEAKDQRAIRTGMIVAGLAIGLPVLVPLIVVVGPWAMKSCAHVVRPFPTSCELNETLELSGDYTGTEPLFSSIASNCKIHIKNAKLKAPSLLKTDAYNLELTLDNVTLDTTDTAITTPGNTKLKIHGSTITSAANVIDVEANFEIVELTDSTLESTGATAIKTGPNMKLHAENSKIRGKKLAIDTSPNLVVGLKKACEITSSAGIAIKTSSSFVLTAEGGKIDGSEGAIVATSSMEIEASALTISSKSGPAIQDGGVTTVNLTGGAITSGSTTEPALISENSKLTFVGTTITGVFGAMDVKDNTVLKASKGTRIIATAGNAIVAASNSDFTIADASVEGALRAIHTTSNTKLKLGTGAKILGKRGAIDGGSSLEITATGASVDGGSGAAITSKYDAKLEFTGGSIKGTPALQLGNAITASAFNGTKIDGAIAPPH